MNVFEIRLFDFIDKHIPELLSADKEKLMGIIGERAKKAVEDYENAIKQGYDHLGAMEIAVENLYRGFDFVPIPIVELNQFDPKPHELN
jgi:hypothetical protein